MEVEVLPAVEPDERCAAQGPGFRVAAVIGTPLPSGNCE